MKGIRFILFIFALSSCSISGEMKNCSTFMLRSGENIFVGHNLDESPDLHVPGMICINKRNIYREGITWSELTATPSDYEKAIVPFDLAMERHEYVFASDNHADFGLFHHSPGKLQPPSVMHNIDAAHYHHRLLCLPHPDHVALKPRSGC